MSAHFITREVGKDLFKTGGTTGLIVIPELDNLADDLELVTIYNSVAVQLNETLQYFLTFDDVIKFIWFGKGVGSLVVDGTMYSDCDGDIPSLHRINETISSMRGELLQAQVGSMTLDVILAGVQVTTVPDPDTLANFQFNLSIVNHNM